MTTGALIFAYNNDDIDYVKMAAWNASNIRRHLGIPTTLVTDKIDPAYKYAYDQFDWVIHQEKPRAEKRYFDDFGKTVDWYNTSRPNVLDITPWDRTIVLDADYVVASGWLTAPLSITNQDFWCYHHAYDLTTQGRLKTSETFGEHDFPMSWATVMIFNKTNQARFIFDSMQMIRNNWDHYRDIYKIQRPTYRNDIALSIALKLVYPSIAGSGDHFSFGKMASVMPEDTLTYHDNDMYKIEYTDNLGKLRSMGFSGVDFHAMNKRNLGEIVAANF